MNVGTFEETNLNAARPKPMAERTEAACLLETGALYRRRIGLEPSARPGDLTFAGLKHGAFSLYFGDEPIYHFDREGRWQRAYIDGRHYLKGLGAEVHAIDRVREGAGMVLRRRQLRCDEVDALDESIRAVALHLLNDIGRGQFRRLEPPSGKAEPLGGDELHDMLETIARWDAPAWRHHREQYASTYGPLPFLPPECLGAVVLQATLGHKGGRAFGGAPASDFHLRTTEEFARHARDVATLWGRRLLQSRLIFLAGGDLLHQPAGQVEADLAEAGRAFPIGKTDDAEAIRFDGVHAFLDDFGRPGPRGADWRRLAERGLLRLSLGVESGDPEVRSLSGKDWADDDLRAFVADVKAAGLGVSVLTLVGGGGVDRAGEHLDRTSRLIASLELSRGDFVFLLDENEVRDPDAEPLDCTPLPRDAWGEQQQRLKESLAALKGRGIKVLPYTLEKQWT